MKKRMNSKWVSVFLFFTCVLIFLEGLALAADIPDIVKIPSINLPSTSGLVNTHLTVNPVPALVVSGTSSDLMTGDSIESSGYYFRPKEDFSKAIKVSEVTVEEIGTNFANAQWITIGGVAGEVHKYDIDAGKLIFGPYHEPNGLLMGIKQKVGIWLAISIPASTAHSIRYITIITDTGSKSPYDEIDGIKVYNGNVVIGTYNTQAWKFGGVRLHTLDLGKWVRFTRGMNIILMINNTCTTASRNFILNGIAAKEEW